MARLSITVTLLLLGLSLCTAERQLLSKANKCVCGPHVDDRTPAEICATQYTRKGVTYYCNAGGYFPVLEGGCNKFFTCDAAGNAFEIACPDGLIFDVTMNTCVDPNLEIDGKKVCSNKCLGFLYKPKKGCYNLAHTNSGEGTWGLWNTGAFAVGCGNTGGSSVGTSNTGGFSAGCQNTGTASWGIGNSGGYSCGDGVTDTNHITTSP